MQCRYTLRPSGGLSGGKCEPTLLPVWRHRERGVAHGEQQLAEPHSDVQGDGPAGGAAGPGPAQVRHAPLRAAGHQGQGLHEDILASHPPCKPLHPHPPDDALMLLP